MKTLILGGVRFGKSCLAGERGELSRRCTNASGWLHQEVAAICEHVVFTVAGLPLYLKGTP